MNSLASFASNPNQSRGRLIWQDKSATRSEYQRDRDRIIHSTAFRRLKYKTQVFVFHEGDHYRTRLTHSLEVSQIARSITRYLGLNEDLAEALSLAHDLGHTPFGHAGERALNKVMAPFGGFDHNAQTLRVVTSLEKKYAEFDGLNLTWECLEGLAKHNGPILPQLDDGSYQSRIEELPFALKAYNHKHDLELHTFASLEAQIAALSDDIAYNAHDIDDGVRAGLFSLKQLEDAPLIGPIVEEVGQKYPDIEEARLIHESLRRLITLMVNDLIGQIELNLAKVKPKTSQDMRHANQPMASFSTKIQTEERALKQFLRDNMYQHDRVNQVMDNASQILEDLFHHYMRFPEEMFVQSEMSFQGLDELRLAREVCDYIAGMTDRFSLDSHSRLFDHTPELR